MRRTILFSILMILTLFPRTATAAVHEPTLTLDQCKTMLANADPALQQRFQLAWERTEHRPDERRQLIQSLMTTKADQDLLEITLTGGKATLFGVVGALAGGFARVGAASFGPVAGAVTGFALGAGASLAYQYFTRKPSASLPASIGHRNLDMTMDLMGVPRVEAAQPTARGPNFDTLESL